MRKGNETEDSRRMINMRNIRASDFEDTLCEAIQSDGWREVLLYATDEELAAVEAWIGALNGRARVEVESKQRRVVLLIEPRGQS